VRGTSACSRNGTILLLLFSILLLLPSYDDDDDDDDTNGGNDKAEEESMYNRGKCLVLSMILASGNVLYDEDEDDEDDVDANNNVFVVWQKNLHFGWLNAAANPINNIG
jgi:hypothetical protein